LACSSRHVFGLNSCGRFDWWWLRFDVIKDFLDEPTSNNDRNLSLNAHA
jgi:hypothetical protein